MLRIWVAEPVNPALTTNTWMDEAIVNFELSNHQHD